MKILLYLTKGEITRLFKYKTLIVGLIVSFLWVLIIAFSDEESAMTLLPMLIFVDAAMMSILLLAASFYFEKQEEITKTLLVTPIKLWQLLGAKILASLFSGLLSTLFVVVTGVLLHGIEIAYLKLLIGVVVVIVSHTAIGYVITLYSRDFSSMIIRYAAFALIFLVPSILVTLNVFTETFANIVMISPSHSGQVLLNSAFTEVDLSTWWIGLVYLLIVAGLLYPLVVYPKYKKVSLEG